MTAGLLSPRVRSSYVVDLLSAIESNLAQGDWPGAVTASQEAAAAAPWDAHVLHASGRLCELADQTNDAFTQWVHAVSIDDSLAPSWAAIGTLLSRGIAPPNPHLLALLAFSQACRSNPKWILAAWHLALLYHALGHHDAAQVALERVGHIIREHANAPDNVGIANMHNRAYLHLTLGHWELGYACYEARLEDVGHRLGDRAATRVPEGVPRWTDGTVLPESLAIFVEQGAGDMFMTLRYARALADRGVRVVLETFPSMHRYVSDWAQRTRPARQGFVSPIEQDAELPFPVDRYVWAMSLPGLLWEGPENIPRDTAVRTRDGDRPYVAFAWQGSRAHKSDRIRSCPPEVWESLAGLVEARGYIAIALNIGEPTPDFLYGPEDFPEVLPAVRDFADTARILERCAAVVSVDTALVHLAGVEGVPTFAALAALPDWRWGLTGPGPVWYPTVSLVRQPVIGDWQAVAEAIGPQLLAVLRSRS